MLFFDEATYNPCQTKSNQYFYSDPEDTHQYYQCDETGIAYLRSCGELVWDDLRVTCNWKSAVAPPPSKINPTETTPSWPTTTTESSWTTDASPSSLCTPLNPCGEHGRCLESPITVPQSARRFACICSENWFGRVCDKHIDELTTPAMVLDQNKDTPETMDAFSIPIETENNTKFIFYGLGGNPSEIINRQKKITN